MGATGAVGATGPQGIQGVAGTNALPLFRSASVAVPATLLNVTATETITWSSAFSDTNYAVEVTPVSATGITLTSPPVVTVKTTTGCTIKTTAGVTLTAGQMTLDVQAIKYQ